MAVPLWLTVAVEKRCPQASRVALPGFYTSGRRQIVDSSGPWRNRAIDASSMDVIRPDGQPVPIGVDVPGNLPE
jgi:hypothetical protein